MKKLSLILAVLLGASITACAQVAPKPYTVALTWTIPAPAGQWLGCVSGQPTCYYILSRATITSGSTSCPSVAAQNYTPLNQTDGATGTSYDDTTAGGTTVCYIAQTEQGDAVSEPSAPVGPFVVPGNPVAPALTGSTSTASIKLPQIAPSGPQIAKMSPYLKGVVER